MLRDLKTLLSSFLQFMWSRLLAFANL